MNALNAELIKLVSLRSTWWCLATTLAIALGFAGGFTAAAGRNGTPVTIATTQAGHTTAMMALLALAATFVTSEYRFGTIRAGFLGAPRRSPVLLAKAAVGGVVAAIAGEVTAFASWALVTLLKPDAATGLAGETAWRAVAGTGLVYGVAAVIGVAAAFLIRNSAATVAVLLFEPILLDRLIGVLPGIGEKIQPWMPFVAAENYLAAGHPALDGVVVDPATRPYPPWLGLAYAAGFAAVLLLIATVVVQRSDA